MYVLSPLRSAGALRRLLVAAMISSMCSTADTSALGQGIIKSQKNIIRKISNESERLEITVNSSRILTLETRIPRIQVQNPELLAVLALSDREIQISAKKAGVTQINLWDEEDNIYSVDVLIYGQRRIQSHIW